MKILLTGGSGFVGRNLQEYFKNEPACSEIVLDAPGSKELNVLDEKSVRSWLTGEAEGSSLETGEGYDLVLHFAVYTDAVNKSRDGSKMLEYNLLSFMNFYKYSNLYKRMFYSGSGAEFDKSRDIVMAKEEWLEKGIVSNIPTDQYGLMKYTIGQLINKSSNIYNLRIFGLFGKYEYSSRFITQMCNDSINGKPFVVRRNVFFDYLYITDFIKMLMGLVFKDELMYHSYNMVSGKRISLLEICDMVNEAAEGYGYHKQQVSVENEGLSNEYTADNERILKELPDFKYMEMQDAIKELYLILKQNIQLKSTDGLPD